MPSTAIYQSEFVYLAAADTLIKNRRSRDHHCQMNCCFSSPAPEECRIIVVFGNKKELILCVQNKLHDRAAASHLYMASIHSGLNFRHFVGCSSKYLRRHWHGIACLALA